MSISHELFRRACGRFATGVAVLTARSRDGSVHGLTVNSFTSLSLQPPLVMAAIGHASNQLAGFDDSDSFAVNILRAGQAELSRRFAQLVEGRYEGVPWRPGATGAPVLEDMLCVIECRTVRTFDAGDHRVLIGEAEQVSVGEGLPLIFYASTYVELDRDATMVE